MRGTVGGTAVADRGGTLQPVDDDRDRSLPHRESAGPARPPRWSPLRLPLLILFVGGLIKGLLTWAAASANAGNEHRLLRLQVRQAASALGSSPPWRR